MRGGCGGPDHLGADHRRPGRDPLGHPVGGLPPDGVTGRTPSGSPLSWGGPASPGSSAPAPPHRHLFAAVTSWDKASFAAAMPSRVAVTPLDMASISLSTAAWKSRS